VFESLQVIAFRLVKSDFQAAGDHPPAVPAPKVSPSAAAMLGASPEKAATAG